MFSMENALDIRAIPALRDNYIWRLACAGNAVVIDPGEAAPVLRHLREQSLELTAILLTHRHMDHIGGVAELVAATGVPVLGPAVMPLVSHGVAEGDHPIVPGLMLEARIMALPGHLHEHIAWRIGHHCFCGDVLFSAGCGRVFEGSPRQLYHSLRRLAALPADTLFYPAHEYTQRNLQFAALVEPDNVDLPAFAEDVQRRLQTSGCSLPTTLQGEMRINPFLRNTPALYDTVQQHSGHRPANEEELFIALRRWRTQF